MASRSPSTTQAAAGNAANQTGGSAAAQAANAAQATVSSAMIGKYRPFHEQYYAKFFKYASGHILNKYNVSLQGPYVEEALRVMDLNTSIDRNTKQKKLAHSAFPFKHEAFKAWLDLHYDSAHRILNLLWVSKSVQIDSASASSSALNIDTIKGTMPYPLLSKYSGPATVTISVIDDPYFMWYQFFNALFNVQFSTRVLKVRSTFQKILLCVDVYSSMTTAIGPASDELQRTTKTYYTSDDLAQAYEFNSCIMEKAPKIGQLQNAESGELFSFDVAFKFPNAFQGTSKSELRGLRDNTIGDSVGVGKIGLIEDKDDICKFSRDFFEESRPSSTFSIDTKDETTSLNAISHSYYDNNFSGKLLSPFSKLPSPLQLFPEKRPDAEPKKNSKPLDNSKDPSTDWMSQAQNLYFVDDWQNVSHPATYTPTKVDVAKSSADDWTGVPFK